MATKPRLPPRLSSLRHRPGFAWVLPRTVERIEEVRLHLHRQKARGWKFGHISPEELHAFILRSHESLVWEGERRLEALLSCYYQFMSGGLWSYQEPRYRDSFSPSRYDTLVFVPVSNGRYQASVMAWVINRYA